MERIVIWNLLITSWINLMPEAGNESCRYNLVICPVNIFSAYFMCWNEVLVIILVSIRNSISPKETALETVMNCMLPEQMSKLEPHPRQGRVIRDEGVPSHSVLCLSVFQEQTWKHEMKYVEHGLMVHCVSEHLPGMRKALSSFPGSINVWEGPEVLSHPWLM